MQLSGLSPGSVRSMSCLDADKTPVTRVDGSAVRLHPHWSKTAVESDAVEGHAEEVEIPAHGLGESDGPGTYRHFKDLGTQRMLKFDGTKRPR